MLKRTFAMLIKSPEDPFGKMFRPTNTIMYPTYTREPDAVTNSFIATLTRHGIRRDSLLARVTSKLRLKYGHPAPLDLAIDALRPSVRYVRPKDSKSSKYHVPVALWPQSGVGMAVRWVVKAARERKYRGQRPDLERGLWDELDAVLSGTSSLFAKKANMHRNPN